MAVSGCSFFFFSIFLANLPALPVPTLRLQTNWLDVFPSEKVEFSCSVAGSSDWTFTWFRSGKEVQDSDPNVSLSEEGSVLTITAAEMYSGSYTCKAHHKTMGTTTAASNPLILKVYRKFYRLPSPVFLLNVWTTWNIKLFKCNIFLLSFPISKQSQANRETRWKPRHDVPWRGCQFHMHS